MKHQIQNLQVIHEIVLRHLSPADHIKQHKSINLTIRQTACYTRMLPDLSITASSLIKSVVLMYRDKC